MLDQIVYSNDAVNNKVLWMGAATTKLFELTRIIRVCLVGEIVRYVYSNLRQNAQVESETVGKYLVATRILCCAQRSSKHNKKYSHFSIRPS